MIAFPDLPDPLSHHIRRSLEARIERLLSRPVVAIVPRPEPSRGDGERERPATPGSAIFDALCDEAARHAPRGAMDENAAIWKTEDSDGDEDGSVHVSVKFDYGGTDRGREKEIIEELQAVVRDEGQVVLLTAEHAKMLREHPRAFVELDARPEAVQLLRCEKQWHGSVERVVGLELAQGPRNPASIAAIAVVPNLVQLERQLDALDAIERSGVDGPLAPLRALIGLEAEMPEAAERAPSDITPAEGELLDEHQRSCVAAAIGTDHFAVVHGPPGAGKTTVIGSIIRRLVDRGERVLVVSPTHVAIDNVVEKLTELEDRADDVHPATLPVRFATRPNRLSPRAQMYWSSRTSQTREHASERRVEAILRANVHGASELFDRVPDDDTTTGALTKALAEQQAVICGTPIGILSHDSVANAAPGTFDTLIIDEVSKLTVPEFLGVAVKARRWVLVGDPQQLPPFCDAEECAWTLRDVMPPELELVCSVGAVLERKKPHQRQQTRLVVVSRSPDAVADAILGHANESAMDGMPCIGTLRDAPHRISSGVLVCKPDEVDSALERFTDDAGVLIEIGLESKVAISDDRLVDGVSRAGARIFETSFNTYHAQPWEAIARQKLSLVRFRKGLAKCLPTQNAIDKLGLDMTRPHIVQDIADRLLANSVSVYDLLLGLPDVAHFDATPMVELASRTPQELCRRVRPFTGVLKKQYRMHSSLSRLPRRLFYGGEALLDGRTDEDVFAGVRLIQVDRPDGTPHESNEAEVEAISRLLEQVSSLQKPDEGAKIMVLTAYREQERMIARAIENLELGSAPITVESCTLDSCQGREADYVLLSLVRNKPTPFFDNPKRWNVALTRAKRGLFIVGDIDAYLKDAQKRKSDAKCRGEWPLMSLLSRVIADLHAHSGEPR
ncbi:MAG: AAA domain-containing protein [Phycisphaerales bacterium]